MGSGVASPASPTLWGFQQSLTFHFPRRRCEVSTTHAVHIVRVCVSTQFAHESVGSGRVGKLEQWLARELSTRLETGFAADWILPCRKP